MRLESEISRSHVWGGVSAKALRRCRLTAAPSGRRQEAPLLPHRCQLKNQGSGGVWQEGGSEGDRGAGQWREEKQQHLLRSGELRVPHIAWIQTGFETRLPKQLQNIQYIIYTSCLFASEEIGLEIGGKKAVFAQLVFQSQINKQNNSGSRNISNCCSLHWGTAAPRPGYCDYSSQGKPYLSDSHKKRGRLVTRVGMEKDPGWGNSHLPTYKRKWLKSLPFALSEVTSRHSIYKYPANEPPSLHVAFGSITPPAPRSHVPQYCWSWSGPSKTYNLGTFDAETSKPAWTGALPVELCITFWASRCKHFSFKPMYIARKPLQQGQFT